MKWVETHGRTPRTGERLLHVRYRNGLESKHVYRASQLRWDHKPNNDPWDIVAVAKADTGGSTSGGAWTPVSGGY